MSAVMALLIALAHSPCTSAPPEIREIKINHPNDILDEKLCPASASCSEFMRAAHNYSRVHTRHERMAVLIVGLIRSWMVVQENFMRHVIEANPAGAVDVVFVVPFDDNDACHK